MSKARRIKPLAAGARLGSCLSVLTPIDPGSKEPVYLVWHHEAWCVMACKVMSSLDRALREAEKLKSLSHPSIVRLLDVREPGLLLMPFLEGPRLSDVIDGTPNHRLAISDALRVAIHIGAALVHIHARNMVHLDIKPDNVIVAAGGRPVLFDFGTARKLDGRRPDKPAGTDAYIAPEECRLETTGPAADVFSLGVMLYEMLAGDVPFGKGTAAAPFPQLKRQPAALRKVRRSVPAALENLVFACLEKKPEFRPELPELLPQLNALISKGPRMWPDGFDPSSFRAAAKDLPALARNPARGVQGERQERLHS